MSRYDPTDINAIDRDEAARLSALRVLREQEANDFRWLMQHAQGRRIMRDMLKQAEVNKDCFTGNSTTFYNEGKRSVGLYFEGKLKEHTLDEYCLMLKEQQDNV
jgi:hypothetical protein